MPEEVEQTNGDLFLDTIPSQKTKVAVNDVMINVMTMR